MAEEKGWRDISKGGVITEAGNAAKYETGSWRVFKPVKDDSKCTNCLICWIYCPEAAIRVKDGKIESINMDHCKGCGICAKECPKKAIDMIEEKK